MPWQQRWYEGSGPVAAPAASSDPGCFAELLTSSAPRAYRAAVAILGDRQEAEDALQEAAIVAFRSMTGLRDETAFGAWFLRVAVNKAKDLLRKRKREQQRVLALSQVSPTSSEMDVESTMDVAQAVEQLPVNHRTVVRLYYAAGYSTPEIARMLARPESTVRRLLSEAYRMLRELMAPAPRETTAPVRLFPPSSSDNVEPSNGSHPEDPAPKPE